MIIVCAGVQKDEELLMAHYEEAYLIMDRLAKDPRAVLKFEIQLARLYVFFMRLK